jgi:hypothetical protein
MKLRFLKMTSEASETRMDARWTLPGPWIATIRYVAFTGTIISNSVEPIEADKTLERIGERSVRHKSGPP